MAAEGFLSRYLNGPLPYARRHITVKIFLLSVSLNKTFPSFVVFQTQHCYVPCAVLYQGKEMFYLTTHPIHFIDGYMASDMVKDHSDSERGNPLPPHGLLFSIDSKGSFICTIPQTR